MAEGRVRSSGSGGGVVFLAAQAIAHVPAAAGWDAHNERWILECVCEWWAGADLMVEVGQAFDDHLVVVGVLVYD